MSSPSFELHDKMSAGLPTAHMKSKEPKDGQEQLSTYEMELQIPYCVCAEVSETSDLRETKARNRKDYPALCERKGVEILGGEACPDHIHMLVSIPPKLSVSEFMGYLKGKSSLMIFDQFANMKYRYGNLQF